MKSCALISLVLVVLGTVGPIHRLGAKEGPATVSTNYPVQDAAALASPTNDNRGDLARNAQLNLLAQLTQEHRKRADEAAAANQADRAHWEYDLVNQLDAKASDLLGRPNMPALAESLSNSVPGSTAGEPAVTALNADERAYLAKLQERLEEVRREIATLNTQAAYLAQQASTNALSYGYSSVGEQLQENGRELNQVQRERATLELKQLEFWALRRPCK